MFTIDTRTLVDDLTSHIVDCWLCGNLFILVNEEGYLSVIMIDKTTLAQVSRWQLGRKINSKVVPISPTMIVVREDTTWLVELLAQGSIRNTETIDGTIIPVESKATLVTWKNGDNGVDVHFDSVVDSDTKAIQIQLPKSLENTYCYIAYWSFDDMLLAIRRRSSSWIWRYSDKQLFNMDVWTLDTCTFLDRRTIVSGCMKINFDNKFWDVSDDWIELHAMRHSRTESTLYELGQEMIKFKYYDNSHAQGCKCRLQQC